MHISAMPTAREALAHQCNLLHIFEILKVLTAGLGWHKIPPLNNCLVDLLRERSEGDALNRMQLNALLVSDGVSDSLGLSFEGVIGK
jgi:hypothetical protein